MLTYPPLSAGKSAGHLQIGSADESVASAALVPSVAERAPASFVGVAVSAQPAAASATKTNHGRTPRAYQKSMSLVG